ncbi:MAG: co-chaperone DjlA [Lysobacterales bacterium]
MRVLGKLIGGGLGMVTGGPLGAAGGLLIGHALDAGWLRWRLADGVAAVDPREARVEFLFVWLGHLAKADGRVSESEIAAAERLMQRMGLDQDGRRLAIAAFQRGRMQPLNAAEELRRFRQRAAPGREELLELLRALADFARKDGPMTPAERGLLERLADAMGIPRQDYADHAGERQRSADEPDLARCYALLGIAPSASDAELTRAWRRLVAQHHPDKLQGQGADAAQLRAAEARTRELRAAYERVMAARTRA